MWVFRVTSANLTDKTKCFYSVTNPMHSKIVTYDQEIQKTVLIQAGHPWSGTLGTRVVPKEGF